jgi:hypothetical protein
MEAFMTCSIGLSSRMAPDLTEALRRLAEFGREVSMEISQKRSD